MELKQPNSSSISSPAMVLIVPLWNGNPPESATRPPPCHRLNRTIMELKRRSSSTLVSTRCSLNRTIMELKLGSQVLIADMSGGLNRTIMELKHPGRWPPLLLFAPVLIVPLWNGNRKRKLPKAETASS